MKKSPLSTPSSSRAKQNYNWKSHDRKNRTGYNYIKSDNYQCNSSNESQANSGNDFIPLGISTPDSKGQSGNWYGCGGNRSHRNSGSSGLNHYRNNYHATPKSNFNNSYSPYKHTGKQFYGQKKGYQKDARKQIDISRYIDVKSFLEDPWAELIQNLNKSEETNGGKLLKVKQSLSPQSIYRNSEADSENKSVTDADDSLFSQESKHESSLDVTLGLDDTNVSDTSRTESSINSKLGNVRFSQESQNESFCSNNDSACNDSYEESTIHQFCGSEADLIQDLI
ncbi:uncharacterized protein LOC128891707 [Hylaeus anthracinus]|uniref:uncharacterized protein LOC128891707 n=1 Tax=Hylaeus anthracinus TaxID=313031 RepID=UPI0023BA30B5|nr:uncharacterized protein LOC128891707 [Hylaeus anthracinus]